MNKNIASTLIMACACSAVTATTAWFVLRGTWDPSWRYVPYLAAVTGFFSAVPFWYFFVVREKNAGWVHGAVAGTFCGVFFHYIHWYVDIVIANICFYWLDGCHGHITKQPGDILNGLWGAAVLAVWSLIASGIYTIPGCAIVGGLVGFIFRKNKEDEFQYSK